MKIGIDISQLTYQHTGVAKYLEGLLSALIKDKDGNEYVLFYSSLRGNLSPVFEKKLDLPNVTIKKFKIPPLLLDLIWNKLHIFPIETFIGNVDIFLTSDWTEPPARKALKATILYDLIIYLFPEESTEKIVLTQKRKLSWVKKESNAIFCISDATMKDAIEILKISRDKLHVIHPGFKI